MSRFKGLWQASLNATKKEFMFGNVKNVALTWNLEDLMPPTERFIFNFNSKEELKKWHLYSDSEYGGLSSASLEIAKAENGLNGIFSGKLSLEVTEGSKWNISRSDFCGMRSKKVKCTCHFLKDQLTESQYWLWRGGNSTTSIWMISTFVFSVDAWLTSIYYGLQIDQLDGFFFFPFFEEHFKLLFDGFIDLDAYDTIAMKLKGDGRYYISTIYTENWINSPGQQEDNSWQAFVFVPKDNWYIAKIALTRYLPTWRGNIIDAKLEMNPSRILGMSLSVNAEGGVPGAKSGAGDFRMEIDWIKALRTQ